MKASEVTLKLESVTRHLIMLRNRVDTLDVFYADIFGWKFQHRIG